MLASQNCAVTVKFMPALNNLLVTMAFILMRQVLVFTLGENCSLDSVLLRLVYIWSFRIVCI